MSAEYELVMPFVVCRSQGGVYDDEAFVAGYEAGQIDAALRAAAPMGVEMRRYVHSALLPQLDLIAMEHGYQITSYPWDEHPDEWTLVTIAPPSWFGSEAES